MRKKFREDSRRLDKKCGQANKGLRWIPRHTEAKKDVATDEKLRGAGSKR